MLQLTSNKQDRSMRNRVLGSFAIVMLIMCGLAAVGDYLIASDDLIIVSVPCGCASILASAYAISIQLLEWLADALTRATASLLRKDRAA